MEKKFVPYVDYVLCIPGDPSSGRQEAAVFLIMFELMKRGKSVAFRQARGSYVYGVRNECLKGFRSIDGEMRRGYWIDQKPFENVVGNYDRIIWIDSDNHPNISQVDRLISHDVDIVAGWYRAQVDPITPENNVACGKWNDRSRWDTQIPFKVYEMETLATDEKGLIEVDFTGFGLCIMKKGVMESLKYPWFMHWPMQWTNDNGQDCCEVMSEDVGLFTRLQNNGFKIYIDPKVCIGHEKKVLI